MNDTAHTSGSGLPGTVLEAQVAALLARLEHYRERRCREIRQQAEDAARAMVREAWHAAAARGREALREIRQRMETERQRVGAMVDAELRRNLQRQARFRLDELHERLPHALATRWHDAAARAAWIAAAIDVAGRFLVGEAWVIEHPADIDQSTFANALAALTHTRQVTISFAPRTDIADGIVIASDGARIDATSAGLLADTARIESSFLGQCPLPGAVAEGEFDHG